MLNTAIQCTQVLKALKALFCGKNNNMCACVCVYACLGECILSFNPEWKKTNTRKREENKAYKSNARTRARAHTHTHTHTHTEAHASVCTHAHTHTHSGTCECAHARTHTQTHTAQNKPEQQLKITIYCNSREMYTMPLNILHKTY